VPPNGREHPAAYGGSQRSQLTPQQIDRLPAAALPIINTRPAPRDQLTSSGDASTTRPSTRHRSDAHGPRPLSTGGDQPITSSARRIRQVDAASSTPRIRVIITSAGASPACDDDEEEEEAGGLRPGPIGARTRPARTDSCSPAIPPGTSTCGGCWPDPHRRCRCS